MSYQQTPEGKDPQVWQTASKRASFKNHFATYLIMVAFFWLLWFFTGGRSYNSGLPWPVWPTFGWGIGIFFHYFGAYHGQQTSVEKEYEKLIQKQSKQ